MILLYADLTLMAPMVTKMAVCVCVRACVRARACVCVCLCVCDQLAYLHSV